VKGLGCITALGGYTS